MLSLRLDSMILKVFSNLNDSVSSMFYSILTLRMTLGCALVQLPNQSGTLCKTKSMASATSPVRFID